MFYSSLIVFCCYYVTSEASDMSSVDWWSMLSDEQDRSGASSVHRSSSWWSSILFYLDDWNNCHRRSCDDRYNCPCDPDSSDIPDNFSGDYSDLFTNDRECIDLSWLCDGIPDCSGGEDERDCVCSDDEFQCNNCGHDDECNDGIPIHQCINESRVNDGRRNPPLDCWNANDERYLKVIKLFQHKQLYKLSHSSCSLHRRSLKTRIRTQTSCV